MLAHPFTDRLVALHRGMRPGDLVQLVHAVHGQLEASGGDRFEPALQHRGRQLARLAAVGGEPAPVGM